MVSTAAFEVASSGSRPDISSILEFYMVFVDLMVERLVVSQVAGNSSFLKHPKFNLLYLMCRCSIKSIPGSFQEVSPRK